MANEKATAFDLVTDAILDELDQGVAPWRKPWTAINSGALRANGEAYRGINQFLLSLTAASAGYKSPVWCTFKQAKQWGGSVKKGQKSTVVVYWKILRKTDKAEDGTETNKTIPLLRYFRVFNLDQTEGCTMPKSLDAKVNGDEPTVAPDPIEEAERVVAEYVENDGPSLSWVAQDRAYYRPSQDAVVMPTREQFDGAGRLYGTLFHELGHSTGHSSRLNRGLDTNLAPFGSEDYSREELVAELTSAFVLGILKIDGDLPQSASYVQSWAKALRDDRKAIVFAAARAEKAARMILRIQDEATESQEEAA